MVRVVNLGDKVLDRQLEALGEELERLAFRREAELRPKIGEDVGHVRNEEAAVAQEGRREGGERPLAEQRHHRLDPSSGPLLPGDVDIIGPRFLEREANEFAAPLDAGPVEELVGQLNLRGLPEGRLGSGDWRKRLQIYSLRATHPATRVAAHVCGRRRSAALTKRRA